jgi:hypothetical protein
LGPVKEIESKIEVNSWMEEKVDGAGDDWGVEVATYIEFFPSRGGVTT